MTPHDFTRGGVEVTRAAIVAETFPRLQHRCRLRASQRSDRRKQPQPTLVIWNDRDHLRLLEHDLGNPDPIRVAPRRARTPRQGPSVEVKPTQELFLHFRGLHDVVSITATKELSTQMPPLTSYTIKLTDAQFERIRLDLAQRGFAFREVPYAHFGASKEKLQVTAFQSGKLLLQGKGVEEFVQFYLEPEILGEARLGYEHVHDPTILEPRIGVDESGKGDFFGPLTVAGVFLNRTAIDALRGSGVRDSKTVTSDKRIFELAKLIRQTSGCVVKVVPIGPRAYNDLLVKMRNVNKMLAWGHARVIENVLETLEKSGEECKRAVADQFGDKRLIENALLKRGRTIQLVQRHKAESDLAVAAASIIARDEFVQRLAALSKEYGIEMPKGASAQVDEAGREFLKKHGMDKLGEVAKLHFRTTQKISMPA